MSDRELLRCAGILAAVASRVVGKPDMHGERRVNLHRQAEGLVELARALGA